MEKRPWSQSVVRAGGECWYGDVEAYDTRTDRSQALLRRRCVHACASTHRALSPQYATSRNLLLVEALAQASTQAVLLSATAAGRHHQLQAFWGAGPGGAPGKAAVVPVCSPSRC